MAKKAGKKAVKKVAASTHSSYTKETVYIILCYQTFPPCRKAPQDIRMTHTLAQLGYDHQSSVGNLAYETNKDFHLELPHVLTGSDIEPSTKVQKHWTLTCDLLSKAGRLLPS